MTSLTPEQRERIRKNRERALAIQKQRKAQTTETQEQETLQKEENKEENKKRRNENNNDETTKQLDTKKQKVATTPTLPLEEFEVEASEWVNKKEAKEMYCLPEGTLAVCEVQEKENPIHKGWTPMKLYRRTELRKYAHKRWEGMEGLIAERNQRKEKRLAKDMKEAANIFK
jgi:hypothetical protein